MKLARAFAQTALLSVALALSSASAALLDRSFLGVPNSVMPEGGTFTRLAVGDASEATMRVRWDCGQPNPCVVEGAQYEFQPLHYVMVPPDGVETPAPFFILFPQGTCPSAGNTARVGGWFNAVGAAPVFYQCFTAAPPPRYFRRSDIPQAQLATITLPPNIRTLARDAQVEAQRRSRAQPTP